MKTEPELSATGGITPDIGKKGRGLLSFLALSTGILLGISFPPLQTGILACFALIPILLIFEFTDGYARPLRYTYLTFFILQLVSVYWMGGFVHAREPMQMLGGGLLIFVHPFFFFLPVLGYLLIRRTFGPIPALLAFPFIWTGFEYIHSIGDLAFPWQTLGNTQSYDLIRAQFITITGVYGLSFWIVSINALAFYLLMNLASKRWKPLSAFSFGTVSLIIIIHFIPFFYGSIVMKNEMDFRETLRVGIIQPDTDPFEKWISDRLEITEQLLIQSQNIITDDPDIIIMPENAVPYALVWPPNRMFLGLIRSFIDDNDVPVLTGTPYFQFYEEGDLIPSTAKQIESTGRSYQSYNAAVFLKPGEEGYGFYGKIVLVPFVETIPFGDVFPFAVKIRRSIGIGGWNVGPDTTVFSFTDRNNETRHFGTVICYESVYPGYVRHFTNKGADFLTVITNDSWWGKTPGPEQHLRMSVLRAIENRRSVARSANGGISAFIDPYGRILYRTALFEKTETVGEIPLSDQSTFYARNGDAFAKLCLLLGVLPIAAAGGEKMRKRIFASDEKYMKK